MRRVWLFTVRGRRAPFVWSVLGTRVGVFTGAMGLSGFGVMFVLNNFDQPLVGWIACGVILALALITARWLAKMAPHQPGLALREGTQLGLLRRRLKNPEWSNNLKWPSPVSSRKGNVVILKNGDIWLNYLVEGINFNAHDAESVEVAQRANARLFARLAGLGFVREVVLRGVKVKVPAETLTRRCIDYVPEWPRYERSRYRAAFEGISQFNNMYKIGERNSFERPFWLGLHVGSADLKFYERWLDTVGLAIPQAGIGMQEVQTRERQVWQSLPPEFRPARTNPVDLEWLWDRAASLGLSGSTVPHLPSRKQEQTMQRGNNNFSLVTITTGHEAEALADMFIASCGEQAGGNVDRLRRVFRDGIMDRYRSLRREGSVAVHNPGRRTTDFPDGYTTYQTMLTVASGPSLQGSYAIQKMSGIVDGFHGLDADVVMRITFEELSGREVAKVFGKAQRRNDADDEALSRSEFDAVEYADKDAQFRNFHPFVSGENVWAKVHMSVVFGAANYLTLERNVQKLIDEMAATDDGKDDSFQLYRYVGSQVEMWQKMLPCTTSSAVIDDTRLSATPALLGAVLPLRRQIIGDPYGWPIGVNKENSLGQVVYTDLINPTAAGDGSILLFGEQGTGKSMFVKVMDGAVHDLGGIVWQVDPTGEMEVFASQFPDAVIVDLINPAVSLDLLKCLPPHEAAAPWLDTWCPLLGVKLNSEEYERLAMVIAPGYREVHFSPLSSAPGLRTTRQVFEHIANHSDETAIRLRRAFNAIKALPGAACLLDPIDLTTGKVIDLPAFKADRSRFVVFNSRQYVLRDGETETETSSRIATAVFTAIATLAKFYFDRSPCVNLFSVDEAHSVNAPIIKRNILSDTNLKGRKFKNIVLVSTQAVQHIGDGLDLVAKRGAFRQRSPENAVPALRKVHITPTPTALKLITRDLSPLDSDPTHPNKVIEGREGELLWFDGRAVAKMQIFMPFIPSRAAAADTSPDKIVRVDDHRASVEGRHRVG
jgi:hypothetical protein